MADRKNLCAMIPVDLHQRVTEARNAAGQTNNDYITQLLIEYYEMKKNGGITTMANGSRTMAFQISEELFKRMYDCYLYAYDLDEQRRLAKERAKEQFETRAELITRLGESMIRHLIDVSEKANAEKIDAAHAIRDYLNVHYHLVKEHQFTNAEVEALLEFADPLEVATACWEANTSADFDICDMLDKINAKSDYPLADGTVPEPYVPDGLPELCFSVLPGTGKLICIKRGESGYYPSDWETGNAEKNRETADYANEQLGITKEQELAMLHGSMVGWDTPGADPKTYENPPYSRMLNPKPKHKRQDKGR